MPSPIQATELLTNDGQREQMKKHRLTAEQERYIIEQMERLERFLFRAGFPMRKITMATIYLSADIETLLLELDMQVVSVDYQSFIVLLKDQEMRA